MSFFKTPFFQDLKEVTKTISDDIKNLKEGMQVPPPENSAQSLCDELNESVQQIKKDFKKLSEKIFPDLNKTRNYAYDVEDLVLELDEETIGMENHLAKFGYKPISRECTVLSTEIPEERTKKNESGTPTLSLTDLGDCDKKAVDDLDTTPVLELIEIEGCKKKDEDGDGSGPLPDPKDDSRYHKFKGIIRKLEDEF